jgi:hypothetical protein
VDTFTEDSGGEQFADGQNNRDLRVSLHVRDQDTRQDTQFDTNRLDALKQNPADERYRRIDLPGAPERERGAAGGGSWFNRTTRRVLLAALLLIVLGAVVPFAWNYLQSYESTDDAQIDAHIDSAEFTHVRGNAPQRNASLKSTCAGKSHQLWITTIEGKSHSLERTICQNIQSSRKRDCHDEKQHDQKRCRQRA